MQPSRALPTSRDKLGHRTPKFGLPGRQHSHRVMDGSKAELQPLPRRPNLVHAQRYLSADRFSKSSVEKSARAH
jgi:hypothetical protein